MEKCEIPPSTEYVFPLLNCCAIVIVVQGECKLNEMEVLSAQTRPEELVHEVANAKGGCTVFQSAYGKYNVQSGSSGVTLYRAHINTGEL